MSATEVASNKKRASCVHAPKFGYAAVQSNSDLAEQEKNEQNT